MKQLEVFNKIGGIIKELNDQYKYLEENPGDLNELELELFVANAHFLADHAEILTKISQKNRTTPKPAEPKEPATTITAEKFFEPVVQQPVAGNKENKSVEPDERSSGSIDLSSDTPGDSYSYERKEPEVIRHELVIDDSDWDEEEENDHQTELIEENEFVVEKAIPSVEETPVAKETVIIEEPVKEAPVVAEPAAVEEPVTPAKLVEEQLVSQETEKEEVLTINQRISAQLTAKNNITEQVSAQPVTNLKQAINLNDKLLYIKDLFNGYSLAYSEAIDILNRYNTFEEAEEFLKKNYAVKNNWESKQDTTEKFYTLLRRRYS